MKSQILIESDFLNLRYKLLYSPIISLISCNKSFYGIIKRVRKEMKNKLIEFKEKGLALLQSLKSKITDKIQAKDSNQAIK